MRKKLALAFAIVATWAPLSALALTIESVRKLCPAEWKKASDPNEDYLLSVLSENGASIGYWFANIHRDSIGVEKVSALEKVINEGGVAVDLGTRERDAAIEKLSVCIAKKRIEELQGTASSQSAPRVDAPKSTPSTATKPSASTKSGNKDLWGAIAIDAIHGGQNGFAINHSSQASADKAAEEDCQRYGNRDECTAVAHFTNGCAAYAECTTAIGNECAWGGAVGVTMAQAEADAIKECQQLDGGKFTCKIRASACNRQ